MEPTLLPFGAAASVALAGLCGVRIFAPLCAATVLFAVGAVDAPTPDVPWLWFLPMLGALAVAELVADKTAGVDRALDTAGLAVRPVAAALVAWTTGAGALGTVLGVTLAIVLSAGKLRLRLLAPGPSGSFVFSTFEDLLVAGAFVWIVFAPPLAWIGLGSLAVAAHVGGTLWQRLQWHAIATA